MDFKVYKSAPRYIYTLEEFYMKHPGVEPVYWREAQVGDWALTDDNGVCEILRRKSYLANTGMTQTFVKTATGTYIAEGKIRMDNVKKDNISIVVSKSGHNKSTPSYTSRILRESVSRGDRLYSQQIMKLKPDEALDVAYRIAFPKSKSERYIKRQSIKLYKTRRIQKLLKEEITNGLIAKDVTFGRIVDWMKDLAEDKQMTKQGSLVVPASTKLEIIKEFLALMGAKSETKLIEDRQWHAIGKIGEGERQEVREIGQKAKTTKVISEVGTDDQD